MKKLIKKYGVSYVVVSLFLFVLVLSGRIQTSDWDTFFSSEFSLMKVGFVTFLLGIPLSWLVVKILDKIPLFAKETKPFSKKVYIGFSVGMLAIWMIQYLTFFPGGGMGDTMNILNDPIGISHQHPLIYNLLLTYSFRFFHLFFESTTALGCVTFIQMVLCSMILSFVCYYLERETSSKYPAYNLPFINFLNDSDN